MFLKIKVYLYKFRNFKNKRQIETTFSFKKLQNKNDTLLRMV